MSSRLETARGRICDRFYAWRPLKRLDQIADGARSPRDIGASGPQIEAQKHDAVVPEAEVHALQVVDGLHQQAGADE